MRDDTSCHKWLTLSVTDHQLIPQTPPSRRKSRLLLLFVVAVLGIPAGFLFAHAVRMPAVKRLADYQPAIITRIYDRNGVPFAEAAVQQLHVGPDPSLDATAWVDELQR